MWLCSGPVTDELANPTAHHVRVVCAILASASTFVPVPFIDDFLREKILQFMVSRTLKDHGRSYSSSLVKPLYSESGGCLEGCLMFLVKLPIKLLLFPIRKIIAWLSAIKTISDDLSTMLLLGRALDRCLSRGMLAEQTELAPEATRIRQAFDAASAGFDTTLLKRFLADALGQVPKLASSAARAARRIFRRGDPTDVEAELGGERDAVEEGAKKVEAVMADPQIVQLLERFDEAFDQRLALIQS